MARAESEMRGWAASMVEVADLIGVPAALKLVERRGGTTVYIPKTISRETQPIVRLIGRQAAEQMAAQFGGMNFSVPTLAAARSSKKELIVRAEGGVYEIARRFGVTARYVRAVKNGSPSKVARRHARRAASRG